MNMPESMSQTTFSLLENTKNVAVINARFVAKAIDFHYQLALRIRIPGEHRDYAMLALGYELQKREIQEDRKDLKKRIGDGPARVKVINTLLLEMINAQERSLPVIKAEIDKMAPDDGDVVQGIISLAFQEVTAPAAFKRNFWSASFEFKPSRELLTAWTDKWQERLSREI